MTRSRANVRSAAGVDGAVAAAAVAALARVVEIELAAASLTLPQYRVLLFLAAAPTIPSDLAARLAVRRPSVTSLVDGLVERGLVERKPDTSDRRRVTHLLTDDGRAVLAEVAALVGDRLTEVAGFADPADVAGAEAGLRVWAEALGRRWLAQREGDADE